LLKWKHTYWYLLVFAVCFITSYSIEDGIRAHYDGSNAMITYVLGVIPNFLPAIGLCAILHVIIPQIVKFSKLSLEITRPHLMSMLAGQITLIILEFRQQFIPYETFDWHDIYWTLFGGILFMLLSHLMEFQSKSQFA